MKQVLGSWPRAYLLVWGALLVVLGVGSLVVNADFATGDGVTDEHLFGVFETNGWHGLAGLLAGVASLVAAATNRWVVPTAAGVAVLAGVVPAVIFLVSGDDSVALGLIPVDAPDALTLHLLPGVVGLAAVVTRSG